jgi:hypothetical protein
MAAVLLLSKNEMISPEREVMEMEYYKPPQNYFLTTNFTA